MRKEYKETLEIISNKLFDSDTVWAIIGSGNMTIHGMDVEPNDLDIVCSIADQKKILESLKEFGITEPVKHEPVNPEDMDYFEATLYINGVEISILGNYVEDFFYQRVEKEKVEVDLEGIKLFGVSLEADAKIYQKLKRPEKAKMIKDFLAAKVA